MAIFITIIHIIVAVALIAIVLLQSGKSAGLSGSIAGGAETFFGKNKGRTIDSMLSKWTSIAAIVFILTSLVLALLQ
ncbi:preprotein translocase subunit SecG [Petroclostridium sp. X23]|jgi:preprotein translocase subunit SecG|uniref:preprotein translocase subunit SecG n=1 Tax=Petroclostridium sp. X23 TaxID=3045146 RepID=UPI0024AD35F0|nr:preprotein translocase subunit SecG [Petroclostridium sp. X23]WHH60713.1 preprotein translocase subunit SecG [Petroclostridium sp. X23]